MKKQFRVNIRLRWLVNLIVIVLTVESLLDIYKYVVHSPIMLSMEALSIILVCNFVLIGCSIYLNKLKYVIGDEELVIRWGLGRDKYYQLSNTCKIKEISGLVSYVKVYFSEKTMPVTCLVDNREGFVETLQERSKKSGAQGLLL